MLVACAVVARAVLRGKDFYCRASAVFLFLFLFSYDLMFHWRLTTI
jgi:hypothetical protein